MAHCRSGTLGYNRAQCGDCGNNEWYASSCGDRHCPNCLGPRQAQWSQQVCDRLPDCPHFHVVFTLPKALHEFFERNYRVAARVFFAAAAATLKTFQKNNWGVDGGFLAVLHTWGSALNWHPHLHVLVSGGGVDRKTGRWKSVRPDYLFAVSAMSKVFGAIMLRQLEALDADKEISWPEGLESVEQRRDWRLRMAGGKWYIYSKATLGNTRAVVRYLARYTSRIAMSNGRILSVEDADGERSVKFEWKNYAQGGRKEERQMVGRTFVRSFVRHLVPKGLRRVRYYGWLTGANALTRGEVAGAPLTRIGERALKTDSPACRHCESRKWRYVSFFVHLHRSVVEAMSQAIDVTDCQSGRNRFSLVRARAGPEAVLPAT